MTQRWQIIVGIALVGLGPTGLLAAEDTEKIEPEEIEVTDKKRSPCVCTKMPVHKDCKKYCKLADRKVSDLGISSTVITELQIRELGVTSSEGVVSMTPGLNFFMRGVGLNDFSDAQENSVAVFLDDVYQPAIGGLYFQLFDLQSIQILRGPQSSLFGRASIGGLINYESNTPSEELESYGFLTVGEFNQINLMGAVGGPLSDTVTGRISGALRRHDGTTENRFLPNSVATNTAPDYNEMDARAVRGQLLFSPSDDVVVRVIANASDNDAAVGAWQHEATFLGGLNGDISIPLPANMVNPSCVALGFPVPSQPGTDCFEIFGQPGVLDPNGIPEVGFDPDGDPHKGNYDRNGKVKVRQSGGQVRVEWNAENFMLTSITALGTVDRLQEEDTDMGPLPLIEPTFAAKTDTLTQEILLSGKRGDFYWQGGAYYFNNKVNAAYDLDTTKILGFVLLDADYTQDTESWSLFGRVEYEFKPDWTLVAGLRYTDERKEFDYENIDLFGTIEFCSTQPDPQAVGCPNPAPTPTGPTRPTAAHAILFNQSSVGKLAKQEDDYITGSIKLGWELSADVFLYGSFSRGVKAAGFNAGFLDSTFIFASNTVETIPFRKATLDSLEFGVKSTLFGNTTSVTASIFSYDFKDFQTSRVDFLSQIIFNSDADVMGGELEIVSRPWKGWSFGLGVSILDAIVKDVPSPSGLEIRDRKMVAAADTSMYAMAGYEWPSAGGGHFAILAWANYQNELFYDIQNHPISREDGYTVTNLRFGYTTKDGRWKVAAFVHNLLDEEYKTYTLDRTGIYGFNQQAFGPPRWAGVTVEYSLR